MNAKTAPMAQDELEARWLDLIARKGGHRPTARALPTPDTADDLADMLSDEKVQDALTDPAKLRGLVTDYAAAFNKKNSDVAANTRAQVQTIMSDWISEQADHGYIPQGYSGDGNVVDFLSEKAKRATNRIVHNRGERFSVPNPYNARNKPAAELDKDFTNFGEYFQAFWSQFGDRAFSDEVRARFDKIQAQTQSWQQLQNSFGSIVPSDGGFLIPEVLRSELMYVALENAVVRPRATVIPMESLRVPIPAIDSTTNQGSIYGGIIGYWVEEAQSLVESQAAFQRIVLDAKKLTLYSEIPNELIADAPAFSGFFDRLFPEAITWFEDIAFFTGSGVGEPEGWLNCPATISYDIATTGSIAWSDIVGAYARMLPNSLGRAVWIASPDVFPQLAAMTFGTGQFPALVPIGGGGEPFQLSLLGRPLIISEKAPAFGTAGALSFVDLSYYLIGDRQSMMAASSPHYKFQNDKLAFRMIERVDGRPWLRSAITPENGSSNTLSPFVGLSATHT